MPSQPRDRIARALLGVEEQTDKSHYEALGRFIAAFASAEGAVHLLVRKFSGLSDEKARILFGGMQLNDVIDRLRQFINLDDVSPETFSEIDDCLTQLRKVADRRHRLVHRGVVYKEKVFFSSNFMTSRSIKNVETETYPENLLKNLTLDAGAIFLRLYAMVRPEKANTTVLAIAKSRSWQYRPEPPKPPGQKPRKARGSRLRRPRASRG